MLAGTALPVVGSASGVLNQNQQLGGTASVAVLGTTYFQLVGAGDHHGAIRTVLWAAIGLSLATPVVAALLPRHARPDDAAG